MVFYAESTIAVISGRSFTKKTSRKLMTTKKKIVTSWILTSRQPHRDISVRRRKNRQPRGHTRARKTRKQNKDGEEEDDEEESHKAETVAKKEL